MKVWYFVCRSRDLMIKLYAKKSTGFN